MGTIVQEEWLPVLGFEHLYRVSSLGRVQNIRTGLVLKATPDKDGYLRVSLRKDGKHRNHAVHHLVLNTFVGLREPGEECRHLDDVKGNCRLDNLEWSDHSTNMADKRLRYSRLTIEQINHIRTGTFEYGSIISYCEELGISRRTFHGIRCGRSYSYIGEK